MRTFLSVLVGLLLVDCGGLATSDGGADDTEPETINHYPGSYAVGAPALSCGWLGHPVMRGKRTLASERCEGDSSPDLEGLQLWVGRGTESGLADPVAVYEQSWKAEPYFCNMRAREPGSCEVTLDCTADDYPGATHSHVLDLVLTKYGANGQLRRVRVGAGCTAVYDVELERYTEDGDQAGYEPIDRD